MSLTTHRFNWMGTEHSQSSLQIMNLMRSDSADASATNTLKYKSLAARRLAADNIRGHLAQIKREMELEAMGLDPNTPEATQRAAEETTSLIRGTRYRSREQLVSYIDGSTHDTVAALKRYNAYLHKNLEQVAHDNPREDIQLPNAEDFDGADVDVALKNLKAAQDNLVTVQEEAEQAPAAEETKPVEEEAKPEEQEKPNEEEPKPEEEAQPAAEETAPATEEQAAAPAEEETKEAEPAPAPKEKPAVEEQPAKDNAKVDTAKAEVASAEEHLEFIRGAYNDRARHSSRYFMSFGPVRRADLAEGYDHHATDRVL